MFEKLLKLMENAMPDVDVSKATVDSDLFNDLGFDSLGLMMLSMEIENEFNVRFDKPMSFKKVSDVITYLEENCKK